MDLSTAQALYDKNLSKLMEIINKNQRGVWSVMMDSNGLIESIKQIRVGKPRANCFTLIVPGNNKTPTFGAFNCLDDGFQKPVAELMKKDIEKLLHASKVASALKNGRSEVLQQHVENRIHSLEERFGVLPSMESEFHQEEEEEKTCQQRKEMIELERQKLFEEIPASIFEDYLEQEKQRLMKTELLKKSIHSKS